MGVVGAGAIVRDSMIGAEGQVGNGETLIDSTVPTAAS
jgi:hypothetical protein